MKNIVIIISVILFVLGGFLFSLISLYASPDEQVHVLEASIFWLGNSIVLLGLLHFFRCNDSDKKSKT